MRFGPGGTISVVELGETLTKLFRRRPTQYEMKRLIETVDLDGSGSSLQAFTLFFIPT